MDLVFARYANPFELLDNVMQAKRLNEFICNVVKTKNDEEENETIWEYYLHRVFDKSYSDFLKEAKPGQQRREEVKSIDYETTVKESYKMLGGFVP